jgi:ribose transport system substrate-binding protein
MRKLGLMSLLFVIGAFAAVPGAAASEGGKFKIFLSLGFVGNEYFDYTTNMIKAMVASKTLRDKVDLEIQVAGPDAQKQSQQINGMVQAGAKAIVINPSSPTGLNRAIRNACDRGVIIFAFDSIVTEPCAHNVHLDNHQIGSVPAEWLAKKLGGKGNIVMVDGVAGTSATNERIEGAKGVFAKYPDIHVIAEVQGRWSEAGARTAMSEVLVTHKWSDIQGIYAEVGCYTITTMEDEANIPDAEKLPCGDGTRNGRLVQMLKPGVLGLEGASGSYRPMGNPGIQLSNPAALGALSFKLAVDELEGKKVPNDYLYPLEVVTDETVKLCTTGTWKEMSNGCNAFQPSMVPPGFNPIFTKETPELGLEAALKGVPEADYR